MKILFAGTPANAAKTLRLLSEAGIEIVGVLTREDALIGRKRVLTPSPVASEASRLGLPVIKRNSVDDSTLKQIGALDADIGVVVAFGSILNKQALEILKLGWVNLHYSLLPKFRGAAPVQHALLQGESTTGVTVFQLDEGMDTGPILLSVPTTIEPGENSGRLLDRLTTIGASALLEILPSISAGIAKPISQDEDGKSFAPKILRDQAQISWALEAEAIQRVVLAMNPEPMAWTTFNGEPFRVLEARVFKGQMDSGTVGSVIEKDGKAIVRCLDSQLELVQVQPAGKNPMNGADWLRGHSSKGQVVLGS